MNNFSLDENQLQRVKYFIWQKGIEDADAINEVIDHFACKVEELINEDMYLPLDKAMQEAYISFGKDGFKIIVNQYRKRISTIYWTEFRIVFKEFLSSKVFALIFLWSIVFGFALYHLRSNQFETVHSEIYTYSAVSSFFICYIYQGISFWNTEKKYDFYFCEKNNLNLWQRTVNNIPKIDSINLLLLFLFPLLKTEVHTYIYFLMLMSFFSLINHLIRKETRKRMVLKMSF